MTTFTNGPAMGKVLCLARAPLFLRVVSKDGREWDALDLVTDDPKPDEKIHVYRRVGGVFHAHVHRSGGRGGWYQGGSYALFDNQPDETITRDRASWQKWCESQACTEAMEE